MTEGTKACASIGVDIAEAKKGLDLVGLDEGLNVVINLGRLPPSDVVEIVLCTAREWSA